MVDMHCGRTRSERRRELRPVAVAFTRRDGCGVRVTGDGAGVHAGPPAGASLRARAGPRTPRADDAPRPGPGRRVRHRTVHESVARDRGLLPRARPGGGDGACQPGAHRGCPLRRRACRSAARPVRQHRHRHRRRVAEFRQPRAVLSRRGPGAAVRGRVDRLRLLGRPPLPGLRRAGRVVLRVPAPIPEGGGRGRGARRGDAGRRGRRLHPGRCRGLRGGVADGTERIPRATCSPRRTSRTRWREARTGPRSGTGWRSRSPRSSGTPAGRCCSPATWPTSCATRIRMRPPPTASRPRRSARSPPRSRTAAPPARRRNGCDGRHRRRSGPARRSSRRSPRGSG